MEWGADRNHHTRLCRFCTLLCSKFFLSNYKKKVTSLSNYKKKVLCLTKEMQEIGDSGYGIEGFVREGAAKWCAASGFRQYRSKICNCWALRNAECNRSGDGSKQVSYLKKEQFVAPVGIGQPTALLLFRRFLGPTKSGSNPDKRSVRQSMQPHLTVTIKLMKKQRML